MEFPFWAEAANPWILCCPSSIQSGFGWLLAGCTIETSQIPVGTPLVVCWAIAIGAPLSITFSHSRTGLGISWPVLLYTWAMAVTRVESRGLCQSRTGGVRMFVQMSLCDVVGLKLGAQAKLRI